METFNRLLVIAHVAGAVFTLSVAFAPLFARKGGRAHVAAGRLYFWAMMWVCASALVLSATKRFHVLLVGVTILAFYATFTGRRCLWRRGHSADNARGRPLDWIVTAAVLLCALAMTGHGLFSPRLHPIMAMIEVFFAALLLRATVTDIRRFFRPSSDPKWWWYYHMERMLGSCLAGVTALCVNQIAPRVPGNYRLLVWFGPTLVVTPLIVWWIRSYRRKFRIGPSATA